MSENGNDIIVFQYFDNAIDANIAKTKLDAFGIPCFLTEENMAGLYPGQGMMAFKVRLHIFANDRERVCGVLMNQDASQAHDGSALCPRCMSDQIIREFPKKQADRLVFVLFGIFLPHKKVNHCLSCDLEF